VFAVEIKMERDKRFDNFAIISRDIDESIAVLLEVMTWTVSQETETRVYTIERKRKLWRLYERSW